MTCLSKTALTLFEAKIEIETLLKLITYVLGFKSVNFIKEIDECDIVRLQISLDQKNYIISRSLHQGKTKATLIFLGSDYSREDKLITIDQLLLLELGIPFNYVPQSGKTVLVSFSELFALMYVSQEVGGTEIQESTHTANERMQRAVFETLLALSGADSLPLEVRKSELEAQKKEIESEIKAYKRQLQELNINKEKIEQKITDWQNSRMEKSKERDKIRQKMRGDSAVISKLNQEIVQLDYNIKSVSEEIALLEEKCEEYRLSHNEVLNEQERLKRYGASKSVLSSFTFSHCPRCSQEITPNMRKREEQGECMLCGRQTPVEQSVDLLKSLDDLEDEAQELTQLLQRYESEMGHLKAQCDQWFREKAAKDRTLDEQMGENYTSAFMASLENISREIATIDEQITQESRWLSLPAKLEELYESIQQIDTQIKEADKKIEKLNGKKADDLRKLQDFEGYLGDFLTDIFRDFKHVEIAQESYQPKVNGFDYKRFSEVQKNLVVLGYHYALLRYSLQHDSRYPKFLMIDTPNKGDMDKETFNLMMRKFADLQQTEQSFQLLITTRDIPDNVECVQTLEEYLLQPRQLGLFETV